MFIWYFAEQAYGHNAGPFNVFQLDIERLSIGHIMLCSESVWVIPGTLDD